MSSVFATIVARDLRAGGGSGRARRVLPIVFFLVAVACSRSASAPSRRDVAPDRPGVVCVRCWRPYASLTQLYGADHADGSLEQMLLSGRLTVMIARQGAGALIVTGAPLVLAAPLFGLLFDLSATANLTLALFAAAGTPHPEPARRFARR